MRIVTKIRYAVIAALLMIITVLMLNFIHESIHILQLGGKIYEVCYLGYLSSHPNWAGWTMSLATSELDEWLPIIVSFIITIPTVAALAYFLFGGIKD